MATYLTAPNIGKPTPPWRQTKREKHRQREGAKAMRRHHDEREAKRADAARSPFDRNDLHPGPHARIAAPIALERLTRTAKSLAAEAADLGFAVAAAGDGRRVHVIVVDEAAHARIAEAWWVDGRFGGALGWDADLTSYRSHNVTTLRAALIALAPKVAS